jgi:biopolymer transport protein ExbD
MAEINMVPLIDVMLVLLVIFIVTAPLLTHVREAGPAQGQRASGSAAKPEKIEFAIDAQGSLFWNGERVSRGRKRCREVRRGRSRKRPQPEVYLRADATVPYRYVSPRPWPTPPRAA